LKGSYFTAEALAQRSLLARSDSAVK
jgi:hypothetical protein